MKKSYVLAALVLIAAFVMEGCKSASSCFTRNGSRVPTVTTTDESDIAAYPVEMGMDQVIYSAPANQCNPCTNACNACDPCNSGNVPSGSNYPGL